MSIFEHKRELRNVNARHGRIAGYAQQTGCDRQPNLPEQATLPNTQLYFWS